MDSDEDDEMDGMIKGTETKMLFLPHVSTSGARQKVVGVGLRPNTENKKEYEKKLEKAKAGKKTQVLIIASHCNLCLFIIIIYFILERGVQGWRCGLFHRYHRREGGQRYHHQTR